MGLLRFRFGVGLAIKFYADLGFRLQVCSGVSKTWRFDSCCMTTYWQLGKVVLGFGFVLGLGYGFV